MGSAEKIKCVIWDLDNTVWEGVLSESAEVVVKPCITRVIETLDQRGILHSISSKNNIDDAMAQLARVGLEAYFLYPQIHWGAKSHAIAEIQRRLNIGMDALLFIDDQAFERDEVKAAHPEITCWDAAEYLRLLKDERLQPRFIARDAAQRRILYQQAAQRERDEAAYEGPPASFLSTLGMSLTLHEADEVDLQRAEELTVRTNQLNATGITYDYDELNQLRQSSSHRLLMAEFEDCYGSYGKIGLVVLKQGSEHWVIELILVSCRVLSRGVGTILLTTILQEAVKRNKTVFAQFRDTGRNKMMKLALRFAGFTVSEQDATGVDWYRYTQNSPQAIPDYVTVHIDDLAFGLIEEKA